MFRRVLFATALLAVSACKDKDSETTGPKTGTPPAKDLTPPPAAPSIQIPQGAASKVPLTVVAARPVGDNDGGWPPTITFSKPVVALAMISEESKRPPPATIDPPLAGHWRWLGSTSVEFVLEKPLPFGTNFKVHVAPAVSLDGSKMDAPYDYEFYTPEPSMWASDPSEGFSWMKPDALMVFTANQALKDVEKHVQIVLDGGKTVPITVVKEANIAEEDRAQNLGGSYPEDPLRPPRGTRYTLKAASPLPLDTGLEVVFDATLTGKEGPRAMEKPREFAFRTHGPLKLVSASACMFGEYSDSSECPWGPAVIYTSNKVDVASLKDKVAFTPPVKIDWDRVETATYHDYKKGDVAYIALPGKFRPGQKYEVKVEAGSKDEFGQTGPAFTGSITLDDVPESLSIGPELALIESARDGALPVESVNIDSEDAEVWVMTPEQLAPMVADLDHVLAAPGTSVTLPLPVAAKKNVKKVAPFELRKALPNKDAKNGLFLVRVNNKHLDRGERSQVIAQVTDLAVHAKVGPKSGAAWVTTLSGGKPVPEAAVRVLDKSGAVKWSGTADADGVAKFPGASELVGEDDDSEWTTPFMMIVAEKDGDTGFTVSTWNNGISPDSFGVRSDWDGTKPRSLGLVFAERGIYRPGDEVHLMGVARHRRAGVIARPKPGTKISVRVTNSRDAQVIDKSVAATAFGTYSLSFTLGKDVPVGTYQISTSLDMDGEKLTSGGTFRVEEYRAPQFKVDVTAKKEVFAGDPIEASIIARYLHGGAMAKAQVHYTITRNTTTVSPPGNEGFAFGSEVWSWDEETRSRSSAIAGSGDGETNNDGVVQVKGAKYEAPGASAQEYTIEADVADVNRQHLANRASVTVHPAGVYAGIRLESTGFAQAGRTTKVELVAAAPDGKRKSGMSIALEVSREEWKSIQKKGVGGQWFTESERVVTKVHSCNVKTAETPVPCELKLEQPGYHILEATVTDESGRKQITKSSLYAIGSGWVSWQRNDTDRIDLVADKPIYDVGDTAKILVKSPYPDAEALFSIEREGVLEIRRVKLGGAATAIEVKIDESMIPNVFAGVILVRGRVPVEGTAAEAGSDPGRPAVRVGYTELRVEKKEKRLAVKVGVDAEKKRPREKVKVDLKVTDHKGRGVKSELAVWAVDEGVLRLTNYRPPDPIEVVHPLRGLSVRIGEPLLHLVLARLYGEKGEEAGGSGGGDASGAGFRSKFKTTPYFAPAVVTDDEGHAQVEFELPDNVTTFRIMAFASTASDRFGTGDASVVVTKPLLAIPALPRVARAGDTFEAGVVVHADAPLNEATVRATATNLEISGPAERSISLADGKPKEIRFKFVAKEPVQSVLRFEVSGGGNKDGVEEKLNILLPVGIESVALYGETDDKNQEGIVIPGGVRPGIGGLDVTMASTILGGFDDGMRQLVEYPYGCLEQLSSRLVPFIALREVQKKFGIKFDGPQITEFLGKLETGPVDPDEIVKRTVRAIQDLQRADGGYGYWPQSTCSSDYASPYAVLALSRAKAGGYAVDGAALQNAKQFLADTVAAGRPISCGFGPMKPSDATRVFALYALARAGSPKPSYYNELFAKRKELPLFAQAMLADAMHIGGGDKGNAKKMLDELLNHAVESAGEVHLEDAIDSRYWSSDVRTTAIVLGTLADISPAHPYTAKIGRYLTRARKDGGRFRTTQEAAFSLLALSDVVRAKEKDTPDFTAKVLLGESELAQTAFKGRSMTIQRANIPMNDLLARGKGSELPFIFKKEGAGLLYYGALLRYAPHQLPVEPMDRGLIVQRWFEPYTGGGQARSFDAGALIRVRLRIATSQERSYIVLDVPLPSGLEGVDTSLASTAKLDSPGEGEGEEYEGEGEGGMYDASFYDPFEHVEYRDDRVVFFADTLPPGVHTASFVARATTPGTFVLSPAHAEEMYAPEVFGRSDGGQFIVGEVTDK